MTTSPPKTVVSTLSLEFLLKVGVPFESTSFVPETNRKTSVPTSVKRSACLPPIELVAALELYIKTEGSEPTWLPDAIMFVVLTCLALKSLI